MTYFLWCQGKLVYKKGESGEQILLPDMDSKKAAVQQYNTNIDKKYVGV